MREKILLFSAVHNFFPGSIFKIPIKKAEGCSRCRSLCTEPRYFKIFSILIQSFQNFTKNYIRCSKLVFTVLKKLLGTKSTQKMMSRSEINGKNVWRRKCVKRPIAPFNPYFVCNTSNCITVRPVRGHLTPKMNIIFFIRNLMLNIFLFNNFFEKSCIFRENLKKLFWGRI